MKHVFLDMSGSVVQDQKILDAIIQQAYEYRWQFITVAS